MVLKIVHISEEFTDPKKWKLSGERRDVAEKNELYFVLNKCRRSEKLNFQKTLFKQKDNYRILLYANV